MNFNDYLASFPTVDHLSGLNVLDESGAVIHHIPAVAGKLGSDPCCQFRTVKLGRF